jgi:hypothetical protein
MPDVINTAGAVAPFDVTRVVGTLVTSGIDAATALNRARMLETILTASGRVTVTTDEIRFINEEIAISPAAPDMARIRRYLELGPAFGAAEEPAESIGIPIDAGDFRGLVSIYLRSMESGIDLANLPSADVFVTLVRLWNSIGYWGLYDLGDEYGRFDDLFLERYLEPAVEVLEARLTKGQAYYSERFDLTIGGFPNSNGVYKDVVNVKKVEGGVKGHVFDVTCTIEKCECDGLQAIQVFYGTRRKDGLKVGSKQITKDGTTYDCFVDGGKESPYVKLAGNPAAHPTKPYYLTPDELKKWVDDCKSIRCYDQPAAVVAHEEAYFETAIICINYQKSGKDKVIKVFRWGWRNFGKDFKSRPGPDAKDTMEESDTVSQEFKDIVKGDYPDYAYD